MSSTNRGAARRALDFYQTPAITTDLLLREIKPDPNGHALEPAAGKGAIMRRLVAYGYQRERVLGIELDVGRASMAGARCGDFLAAAKRTPLARMLDGWADQYDLIITNPPFNLAMEFALACLDLAAGRATVALLLPLPWLGSQKRAAFHRAHPSDIYVVPRPEFAASMSCTEKKRGCEYRETLEIEAPRPRECPRCGASTQCTTTDSIEYAWFCWGPGRGNRWYRLDPKEVAQ